jgi:hypothetical protein
MTMESVDKVTPLASEATPTERTSNSTIEFPYTDLDAAMELVRAVHTVGGTACDSSQLAAQLSMEPKGGGFRIRITGAQSFDLINYERGGRVVLTELGRRAVDTQNDRSVRRDAFLRVPLYQKVFDEYKGSPLPPPPALERIMKGYGVGEKVADKARQVMMRSAKQAGYFDLAGDRLTAPPIRDTGQAEAPPPAPPVQQRGSGNGGGDDADLHPLIKGLLITLPKPQTDWPVSDRLNWLIMANSIFKAIYRSPPKDGDVEIKLAAERRAA